MRMLLTLLTGWGSIFAVMLMRRYGRLPVLFWSQVSSVNMSADFVAYDVPGFRIGL